MASNVTGTVYGTDATLKTSTVRPSPPTLSSVSQSNRTWGKKKSRKQKRPVGTTFSFTLNEQARVSFTFTQEFNGRKVNGKCVAQTKQNRHKPACKRGVAKGSLSFNRHGGRNRIFFEGRISHSNQLKPGSYTLAIVATNSAGQRSKPQPLRFTFVR